MALLFSFGIDELEVQNRDISNVEDLVLEQNSTIDELEDKATLHSTELQNLQLQTDELEKKNTEEKKKRTELEKKLTKQQEEIQKHTHPVSSIVPPPKTPAPVQKKETPPPKKETPVKKLPKKRNTSSEWTSFTLTFYSNSPDQGTNGTTASGTHTTEGRTVACDPSVLPLGTVIEIEGLGKRVCEDTGGAINGRILDVFVESKSKAFKLGRQDRKVRIIK